MSVYLNYELKVIFRQKKKEVVKVPMEHDNRCEALEFAWKEMERLHGKDWQKEWDKGECRLEAI